MKKILLLMTALLLNLLSPIAINVNAGEIQNNLTESSSSLNDPLKKNRILNQEEKPAKTEESSKEEEPAKTEESSKAGAQADTDWDKTEKNDEIVLNKYNGNATELIIPGELNGKQVRITRDLLYNLKDTNVTRLTIREVNGKKVKINNLLSAFYTNSKLVAADLRGLDVSSVTDLHWAFCRCTSLESLDVSNWNTSNVTSMENIFGQCSSLTSLDLSSWNTSNVTNMYMMFNICSSLTSLNVSNWNTSNVTNMRMMFNNTPNLSVIDLSNFDLTNVKEIDFMFGLDSAASIIQRQLLVIAKDPKLKKYDYALSNRLPVGPTLDANGGKFSDGSVIKSLFKSYVVESKNQAVVEKNAYNKFLEDEKPTKVDETFKNWSLYKNSKADINKSTTSTFGTTISVLDKLHEVYYAQWKPIEYKLSLKVAAFDPMTRKAQVTVNNETEQTLEISGIHTTINDGNALIKVPTIKSAQVLALKPNLSLVTCNVKHIGSEILEISPKSKVLLAPKSQNGHCMFMLELSENYATKLPTSSYAALFIAVSVGGATSELVSLPNYFGGGKEETKPDFFVAVPQSIDFTNAETNAETSVKIVDEKGQLYTGSKSVEIKAVSKYDFKLKDIKANKMIPYSITYSDKTLSNSDNTIGTLSKDNATINGKAKLLDRDLSNNKFNYSDTITYEFNYK